MDMTPQTLNRDAVVEFRGIEKRYRSGGPAAVVNLDLTVQKGEFLTLLGPSGSGKTTTLMMLAGFEAPSSGEILLAGKSLVGRPPHRRNMGVVFQNYALFPHMTVAENLAFPLEVRGIKGANAAAKVDAALALVHLDGLGDRRPEELSGGQRQRVALARALIFEPDIVLMDEPLGALDRQLRERLQIEIKRIQRQLGVTVLYVTHDQIEALTLSDRIAIFANGTVQQVGTPTTIYERPANAFVAGFVGENNSLAGVVASRDADRCQVRIQGGMMLKAVAVGGIAPGDAVMTTVRPEHILIDKAHSPGANSFDARIDERVYHGDHSRLRAVLSGGAAMTIRDHQGTGASLADVVKLSWEADRCFAFHELASAHDVLETAA